MYINVNYDNGRNVKALTKMITSLLSLQEDFVPSESCSVSSCGVSLLSLDTVRGLYAGAEATSDWSSESVAINEPCAHGVL